MSKKVLIISTSLRSNSNSNKMAEEFARGAKETGNRVELISLAGKQIGFCKGCLACQTTKKCVIKDDAIEIAEKMLDSDVVVFAAPIYYYEMPGQMKTLLDRMNPLYGTEYKFRDVYFLTCAAEDEADVPTKATNGLQGWIDCFGKAAFMGTVFAGGVTGTGEIEGHVALQESYEMGKNI
ncbi:MAG: flavodoxin family protein [Lachnospiraceae bacterium]|nr:flavodoxin family protein [Lachnospiraceae bacterium]